VYESDEDGELEEVDESELALEDEESDSEGDEEKLVIGFSKPPSNIGMSSSSSSSNNAGAEAGAKTAKKRRGRRARKKFDELTKTAEEDRLVSRLSNKKRKKLKRQNAKLTAANSALAGETQPSSSKKAKRAQANSKQPASNVVEESKGGEDETKPAPVARGRNKMASKPGAGGKNKQATAVAWDDLDV